MRQRYEEVRYLFSPEIFPILVNTTRGAQMSSSNAATAATLLGVRVRTRAQKRRTGERDLWDVIVNNDDITFTHILPRLNANDVKFLYDVNTETRKLIKRSSRKGELKERFKVREMSSISTLEFAWENRSLWPREWDETCLLYTSPSPRD